MKITKIARQKKDQTRYSIYIDGKFALGVHEQVLLNYGLYKDMTVDQLLLNEIEQAESNEKLYFAGLNYLSYGLRSVDEMDQYLQRQVNKQFQDEDIHEEDLVVVRERLSQQTIDRLLDQGYLNDQVYAESYVRTNAHLNQKGPQTIERELRRKGIAPELITQALTEYPESQEYENAFELARKYAKRRQLPERMLNNRLRQHLYTKGYDNEIIQAVLEELPNHLDLEEDDELIDREAQKILRRQQRRHEGYALIQKVKEGLYRRGFNMEVINRWIDNNEEYFSKE